MRVKNQMRAIKRVEAVGAFGLLGLLVWTVAGCGTVTSTSSTSSTAAQSGPQTYFAGVVAGGYSGSSSSDSNYLATYTVDDTAETFDQHTYGFSAAGQQGPQMNYSGNFTSLARGLLNLGIAYSDGAYGLAANGGGTYTYSPPLSGNYAIELANQAGGLVQLEGMPFVPLVAAQSCPSFASSQSFLFVTIPTFLSDADELSANNNEISEIFGWNPQSDTAYGSVAISTNGSTVSFNSIQQFLSSGTQLTSYQDFPGSPSATTSLSGACSPTFYGNTVSVPGSVTILNPGSGQTIVPAAIVGIGPSDLLLEANGSGLGLGTTGSNIDDYQPFLGAGSGAIGLPQPSSAVDVSTVTGAQYLGVMYGGGTGTGNSTSLIGSFGFSSMPTTCGSLPAQDGTMIYGGDFPNNNPADSTVQANGGFGNCDFAVDLETPSASTNGLFPNAKVWVSSSYTGNTTGKTYSFPATAIVGQLNGKYAIFLIGVDTTGSPNQAWGIYLLQSN